ncbi:uncharacterized protein LOC135930181 [Gordionus sp. m RMFG-2023]|uniref:uncharacterized protein LOC135930181 n=1 Tax=Gordionus sp. m RMFG-2023 TaxID=3053472 RepID=UPI0031FC62ED
MLIIAHLNHKILNRKVHSIRRESGYFAVMADRDVSSYEQFSICVRYVDKTKTPKESFISFQKVEDLDAESLTKTLITTLNNNSINAICVAQAYDGASVMKGHLAGVQERYRQNHKMAIYVHCYAHKLNLVLISACKSIPQSIKFFNVLEDSDISTALALIESLISSLSNLRNNSYFSSLFTELDGIKAEEKWVEFFRNNNKFPCLKKCEYVFSLPNSNASSEHICLMRTAWKKERNRIALTTLEAEFMVKQIYIMSCQEFYKYLNDGNILEIFVIASSTKVKLNFTHFFLLNLAVSDLSVGIFCILPNMYYQIWRVWHFNELVCKIYAFIHGTSYTLSVVLLMIITMERYLVIACPLSIKVKLFNSHKLYTILIIWIITIIYNIPKLLFFQLSYIPFSTSLGMNYNNISKYYSNHIIVLNDSQEIVDEDYGLVVENLYNSEGEKICITKMNWELYDIMNFIIWYMIPVGFMLVLYSKLAYILSKPLFSCRNNKNIREYKFYKFNNRRSYIGQKKSRIPIQSLNRMIFRNGHKSYTNFENSSIKLTHFKNMQEFHAKNEKNKIDTNIFDNQSSRLLINEGLSLNTRSKQSIASIQQTHQIKTMTQPEMS